MYINPDMINIWNSMIAVYNTAGIRDGIVNNPIVDDEDLQDNFIAIMDDLFTVKTQQEWESYYSAYPELKLTISGQGLAKFTSSASWLGLNDQ